MSSKSKVASKPRLLWFDLTRAQNAEQCIQQFRPTCEVSLIHGLDGLPKADAPNLPQMICLQFDHPDSQGAALPQADGLLGRTGLEALLADRRQQRLGGKLAVDAYLAGGQIDLDPGAGVEGLHGLADGADTMAAGHALNLEYLHGACS